jgi:hypothetical protein
MAQQNLAFFAPRTPNGFGFPASAKRFTKLEIFDFKSSARMANRLYRANQNLVFFAPRTPNGFGFPANTNKKIK